MSPSASATDNTNNNTSTPVPKLTPNSQTPLLIKKLSPKATTPTRGSAFAAGYDLYAAAETVVPARGKVLVDTELAIAVPEGTCKPPYPSHHSKKLWRKGEGFGHADDFG
jgi:dUTP pyrophosphatase